MPSASNEEQFKFLISCIRYSNNGKVDFGQVAQECKIVSKGAAAKRYERMMRAHGIAPNAAAIKPAPSRATKSERKDSVGKPSKKRKADVYVEDNIAEDDEEVFPTSVKADPSDRKENHMVKTEGKYYGHGQKLSIDEANHLMQYYGSSAFGGCLGGEQVYPGSEFGGAASGYATPISGYSMHSEQPFDFDSASTIYGNPVMSGGPRSVDQDLTYQSMVQLPSDPQGRSDSPFIVD